MSKQRRFAKMYDLYADDIYRYLFLHVRDQHTAEDLTADTFMKAWRALESFDFKQPRPWLYKIARNVLTDYWRKRRPEPVEEIEESESDENIEESVERRLTQERVQQMVSELPEMMRSVVMLRFLLNYTAKKTADDLGLTESNVRVLQYRALKKLKEMMA